MISKCSNCEKDFSRPKKSYRKTCSDQCRRELASKITKRNRPKKYINCLKCGTLIWKTDKNRKYCSKSCSTSDNRTGFRHSKKTLKNISEGLMRFNSTKVKKKHILECKICMTSFESKTKNKLTCSKDCFRKAQSVNRIKYLKQNAGSFNWIRKNQPNYTELNFKNHLEQMGYEEVKDFLMISKTVQDDINHTFYILDFYFPNQESI